MKIHRPLLLVLTSSLVACATGGHPEGMRVTVDQLVSSAETFDGQLVTLDACVFVTMHGMALYNCHYRPGQPDQLIAFNPLPGVSDRAYNRLVDLGHEGFAVPKFEVRADITGIYIYREHSGVRELLIMDTSNVQRIAESE